jgi:hypothetical protein
MSGTNSSPARTRKTLVVTAPDGTEVTERTSGGYDTAGIIQDYDGKWHLAAHGWSRDSVWKRTRTQQDRQRCRTMYVGQLREQTAPAIHDYFGTNEVRVHEYFVPGRGWVLASGSAGRSVLRQLAKDGVTAVAITPLFGHRKRYADFQMGEVLASMKTRRAA